MGWMSLDELHAAIRQASGGTISQASGLIARPKSSLKSLNFSEIMLFLEEFRFCQERWRWQGFPGSPEIGRPVD